MGTRTRLSVAIVLVCELMPVDGAVARTAPDLATARAAALEAIAEQLATTPDELTVLGEGTVTPWETGPYYHVKAMDRETAIGYAWVDLATGVVLDRAAIEEATAAAPLRSAKLSRALSEILDASAGAEVTAAVFGPNVEPVDDLAAYQAQYPDVPIVDGVPAPKDGEPEPALLALRAIRREHVAAAESELLAEAEQRGLRVEYAAAYMPLIFVSGPADAIRALAASEAVVKVDASTATQPSIAWASQADGADDSHTYGWTGAGADIAVVEYANVDWTTPDLACIPRSGANQRAWSYTIYNRSLVTRSHPTWVMSAIAAQCNGRTGIAPGARYMSVATGQPGATGEVPDYEIVVAMDLALNSAPYPDVINLSLVADSGQYGTNWQYAGDGAAALEAYVDNLVDTAHVSIVAAGGNSDADHPFGQQCPSSGTYVDQVMSPGGGFNVLTVGGYWEKDTAGWTDDVMWYDGPPNYNVTPGFCYVGPLWNDTVGLKDRVKPEIAAPAVCVAGGPTNNGLSDPFACSANGVSIAVPQAAGSVGLIVGQDRTRLAGYPERSRAVLIAASYLHQTPGGSLSLEGYGSLHSYMGNKLVQGAGYGTLGGATFTHTGSSYPCVPASQYVTVSAQPTQRKLRFALSWHSHGFYTSLGGTSASYGDALNADFDLFVRDTTTGGLVASGTNESSSSEIADWFSISGHAFQVELRPTSWSNCARATETTGWAYVTYDA